MDPQEFIGFIADKFTGCAPPREISAKPIRSIIHDCGGTTTAAWLAMSMSHLTTPPPWEIYDTYSNRGELLSTISTAPSAQKEYRLSEIIRDAIFDKIAVESTPSQYFIGSSPHPDYQREDSTSQTLAKPTHKPSTTVPPYDGALPKQGDVVVLDHDRRDDQLKFSGKFRSYLVKSKHLVNIIDRSPLFYELTVRVRGKFFLRRHIRLVIFKVNLSKEGEVRISQFYQPRTITHDIENQAREAYYRCELGDSLADQGEWQVAAEQWSQALQIADKIGSARVQCEARLSLAESHLLKGDPNACRAAANEAIAYDYPPQNAQIHLLLGIAQLRLGANSEARQSFTTAVEHTDELLQHTPENYSALDRKALALCGLALTGQPGQLPDAIAAFRAARAITTAPGIVARTLRLLNAIAASDTAGLLTAARAAAEGQAG